MAHTVNVNVRMDEELKKQAEQLFAELGINMTTAVNMFIRQSVNYGGIPFDIVRKDPFFSETNMARLKKSVDELNAGKGTVRELVEGSNE